MKRTTICPVIILCLVLLNIEPVAFSRATGDVGVIEPQLSRILEKTKEKGSVLFLVNRGGRTIFIAVKR